jgi:hypothetical protein
MFNLTLAEAKQFAAGEARSGNQRCCLICENCCAERRSALQVDISCHLAIATGSVAEYRAGATGFNLFAVCQCTGNPPAPRFALELARQTAVKTSLTDKAFTSMR